MPDGDIIHNQLGRFYQKLYRWLCEGKATTDECARVVMEALREDLKKKGNLPVMLAQPMAEIIQAASAASENGSVDLSALSLEFDKLIQQTDGSPHLKELTLRAGKSFLHDFRYEQEVDIDKASAVIVERYMSEVYESEFNERIPLTSEHHAGIDEVTLNQRVKDIDSGFFTVIHQWAKKADADRSMEKLRLPRRSQVHEIDLEEDLLCAAS